MENIEIILSEESISEEDIQAVFQLTKELDKRWNQHDPAAFADLFENDADFRFYKGDWVKGKTAIESFWKGEVFPSMPEIVKHRIIVKRVRFVSPNLAIGDGVLQFVDSSGGTEYIQVEREGTLIAVKKGGRWIISAVRLV
jgi:uncharacterized protein (TIGR02246 family)